jgi:hypothetical protein
MYMAGVGAGEQRKDSRRFLSSAVFSAGVIGSGFSPMNVWGRSCKGTCARARARARAHTPAFVGALAYAFTDTFTHAIAHVRSPVLEGMRCETLKEDFISLHDVALRGRASQSE